MAEKTVAEKTVSTYFLGIFRAAFSAAIPVFIRIENEYILYIFLTPLLVRNTALKTF